MSRFSILLYLTLIHFGISVPVRVCAQNDMRVVGDPFPPKITDSTAFTFLVRFENQTGDSVRHIAVRDTLDHRFDPASLQTIMASHTYTLIHDGGSFVRWYFKDINMPPNGLKAKGWVLFKVQLKSFLLPGQVITNRACTVFDDGHSVCTNETFFGFSEPSSSEETAQTTETTAYTVRPNPNYGSFELLPVESDQSPVKDYTDCWITDIQGRRVWQGQVSPEGAGRPVLLERPTPGLYFLYAQTQRNLRISQFTVLR